MVEGSFMKNLRRNMKFIFILAGVLFIAMIVFQWGMKLGSGRSRKGQENILGIVNGRKIDYQNYSIALDNAYRQAQQQGEDVTDAVQDQIREQTWQRLVNNTLLSDEMKSKLVRAGDDELYQAIKRNPPDVIKQQQAFLTDGKFDMSKYEAALNDPGVDWSAVEQYVRSQLPYDKLTNVIQFMTFAETPEAQEEVVRAATNMRASYLRFLPFNYKDGIPKPSDDDLKAFYKEHQNDYIQKEAGAVLDYVFLPVIIGHKDSAEAKSEIDTIYSRLEQGDNFFDLANGYSQDQGTAKNGGLLGWAKRGQLVPEFEAATFPLDSGQYSKPFLTQFGWHISLGLGKKVQDGDTLFGAAHILIRIKPSYDTMDSVSNLAADIRTKALAEGLKKAAEDEGLNTISTGEIHKNTPVPGIGNYSLINAFALSDTVGAVTDVIGGQDGYYVYQITGEIPEGLPPFEKIKDKLAKDYIQSKSVELAKNAAQAAYREVLKSGSLETDILHPDTTGEFTAYSFIPGIGQDAIFAGVCLGLPVGKISKPFEGAMEASYIVQVTARHTPPADSLSQQIGQARQQIYAKRRDNIYQAWFNALREKASIEDYRPEFFSR